MSSITCIAEATKINDKLSLSPSTQVFLLPADINNYDRYSDLWPSSSFYIVGVRWNSRTVGELPIHADRLSEADADKSGRTNVQRDSHVPSHRHDEHPLQADHHRARVHWRLKDLVADCGSGCTCCQRPDDHDHDRSHSLPGDDRSQQLTQQLQLCSHCLLVHIYCQLLWIIHYFIRQNCVLSVVI